MVERGVAATVLTWVGVAVRLQEAGVREVRESLGMGVISVAVMEVVAMGWEGTGVVAVAGWRVAGVEAARRVMGWEAVRAVAAEGLKGSAEAARAAE